MKEELKWKNVRLPGVVLWYGGKGGSALPRLIKMTPYTKYYVEPYGGAASVLFTRRPSEVEVYNDLDIRLVNLMRVLQDEKLFWELYHRSFFTLYSFDEFKLALAETKKCVLFADSEEKHPSRDDEEIINFAWAFFTQQNQGYGGISKSAGNWGRAFTDDKGIAKKVSTYAIRVDRLPRHHQRLRGVHILSEDALDVIEEFDSEETTFYLDPPYTPDSRVNRVVYSFDQGDSHHKSLVETLVNIKGAVVLSGYNDDIYAPLEESGWERIEFKSYASAAARNRNSKTRGVGSLLTHAPRVEVIWRSPLARKLLPL